MERRQHFPAPIFLPNLDLMPPAICKTRVARIYWWDGPNDTNCMAEKSNAERYEIHFSAFDVSAKPEFSFCLDRIDRNKQFYSLAEQGGK
jgi:hypothetical protein